MTEGAYSQRRWFNPFAASIRVLPFRFHGSRNVWREIFVPSWTRQTGNNEELFRAAMGGTVEFLPVEVIP